MNRTVRAELSFHHLVVTRHANHAHSVRALACVTSGSRHDRQAQQREPDEMVSVDKGHYVAVISADPSLVKPKLGSTADRIGWLLLSRAEKYGRRIRWQLIDKVRRVRDC